MTGATTGAGTVYLCGAPEFTYGFQWVRVARSLVFCVVLCRSLFVFLCLYVWLLCCLSFFDLRILIIYLVSSTFVSNRTIRSYQLNGQLRVL